MRHRSPRLLRYIPVLVLLALPSGQAAEQPVSAGQFAHVAVVLPLASPSFEKFASAVLRGVLTAASAEGADLPVYVYETKSQAEMVLLAYDQAVRDNAAAVIGPLTRSAVAALATRQEIPVPTIALNLPQREPQTPEQLYFFGMQIESEARQIAKYAFERGKRSAFIVASSTPLEQRIGAAFKQAWIELSGTVADEFEYTTGIGTIGRLRHALEASDADIAFLALNEPRVRFIRPYLTKVDAIIATSLVFADNDPAKLYDLEGVMFVDIPWLLKPDHPAVVRYDHPETRTHWLDEQRFHAMGIDAYRLAQRLVSEPGWRGTFEGVTGELSIDANQTVSRVLLPAQFLGGRARMLPTTPLVAETEPTEPQ